MAKIVKGTTYKAETPPDVIAILEEYRSPRLGERERLTLFYGNPRTGLFLGFRESGYIGRSYGPEKIPLVVHNRRSLDGGAILDSCIVRIETARGRRTLYAHPNFHEEE